MTIRRCLLYAFLLLFLVNCNGSGKTTPKPTETAPKLATQAPHIRGTVTQVFSSDNQIISIFVEGNLDQDTLYEKAIVGIGRKTLVYYKQDGNFKETTIEALSVNSQIEALFTGPIATSFPVQATAEEIVILK